MILYYAVVCQPLGKNVIHLEIPCTRKVEIKIDYSNLLITLIYPILIKID